MDIDKRFRKKDTGTRTEVLQKDNANKMASEGNIRATLRKSTAKRNLF